MYEMFWESFKDAVHSRAVLAGEDLSSPPACAAQREAEQSSEVKLRWWCFSGKCLGIFQEAKWTPTEIWVSASPGLVWKSQANMLRNILTSKEEDMQP